MSISTIFGAITAVLWLVGMLRMGFRRRERVMNGFFLGLAVMSFASMWISLLGKSWSR